MVKQDDKNSVLDSSHAAHPDSGDGSSSLSLEEMFSREKAAAHEIAAGLKVTLSDCEKYLADEGVEGAGPEGSGMGCDDLEAFSRRSYSQIDNARAERELLMARMDSYRLMKIANYYASTAGVNGRLKRWYTVRGASYADAVVRSSISNFSLAFIRAYSLWRDTRDVNVIEHIRTAFIDAVVAVADVLDIAIFEKTPREISTLKQTAGVCDTAIDAKMLKLPEILPRLSLGDDKPGLSVVDEGSVPDARPGDIGLLAGHLPGSGSGYSVATRLDGRSEKEKDFWFLQHYGQMLFALIHVSRGDFKKAAQDVKMTLDHEIDGTGDCFVASALDALSVLDTSIAEDAASAWSSVRRKLFSGDSCEISLDTLCARIEGRSVSVLKANKVQVGTLIIRRYDLAVDAVRKSAEREIALSQFAGALRGGEVVVPAEVDLLQKGSLLFHIEKRLAGPSFEEILKRYPSDAPYLARRILLGIMGFHRDMTKGALESRADPVWGYLDTPDYHREFKEKFIDRFKLLAGRTGIDFDAEALSQAMDENLYSLRDEPEGIVHNDLRGANIIVSARSRVGFVDLEKMNLGKFIFDIAGFIEHSKVEGNLCLPGSPNDSYWVLQWYPGEERSPAYYLAVVPSAAMFKISHLCGSVVKHHLDPVKWDSVGRSRVSSYLSVARRYAGDLRRVSAGALKSAASEMEQQFGLIGRCVKKSILE